MHFFENVYFFLSMRTILGEGYKDQGDIQCKEVGKIGRLGDASGRKELRNPK
jgi:hypothetical protein